MSEGAPRNLNINEPIELDEALRLMDIQSPPRNSRDRQVIAARLFEYGFITAKLEEETGLSFAEIPKPIVRPLVKWFEYKIGATVERFRILSERRQKRI